MAFVHVSFRDVEDKDRGLHVRIEDLVGHYYFQGDRNARQYYLHLGSKSKMISTQYYLKVGRRNFWSNGSEHGFDTIERIVFLGRDLEAVARKPNTGEEKPIEASLGLEELFSILTDALLVHYNERIRSFSIELHIPQPEVLLIDGSPSDQEVLSILNAT